MPVPALGLEVGRGTSAVLLVAPHGGRRPPIDVAAPPAHLRVNDVYTPDCARELACRLQAGFIINEVHDRNTLDLNRVSQVQRRARWFLDVLAQEIAAILQRHHCAEIVFVHGWNVGQPKCDIGVGAVENEHGLSVAPASRLTVSETYVAQRLNGLRAACLERGIVASVGVRYPGEHPNNILQLFSDRGASVDDPAAQRIADWAMRGRLNALQLELGIPLRWPGRWRAHFVDAVCAAFRASGATRFPRAPEEPPRVGMRSAALQFYDPNADVGMFAGVAPMGPSVRGGRLLLFLGGQRIALFTGEETGAHDAAVPPLRLERDGECLRLQFSGPMLRLEDAATYIDLEAALAASLLMEAEIRLSFRPPRSVDAAGTAAQERGAHGAPIHFGVVEGSVMVGMDRRRIAAGGFANAGALRASGAAVQTMLAASFGLDCGLLSRGAADGRAVALRFDAARSVKLAYDGVEVSKDGDGRGPSSFAMTFRDAPVLHGRPLSRMAILRPAGKHHYLHVTFGVAQCTWGARKGYGLYEHAEPIAAASPRRS